MNFSAILTLVDKYIKIKPWLQFVGLMVAFGGLIGAALEVAHPVGFMAKLAFGVAFVGLGVSAAGFDYNEIYP